MKSIENRRPSVFNRRWFALPLLASLTLGTGCLTDGQAQSQTNESKTRQSVEVDPQQLAYDALKELRETVSGGKPVSLSVAKNTCLYWGTSLGYTVIRKPAFFTYDKGAQRVIMLPFIQSTPEGKPVIMNGPASPVSKTGGTASLPIKENQMSGDGNFEQVESSFKLEQATNPEAFPPAWLLAEDGSMIAETQIIARQDLPNTFSDTCDFVLPQEAQTGQSVV